MNALEQQREDQAFGAAWRRAEAALPPGAVLEGLGWEKGKDGAPDERYPDRWHARAYRWDAGRPWHRLYGRPGLTPTDALNALADALEQRRAEA